MDLVFLASLAMAFWWWWDNRRAGELAMAHCRRLCAQSGVQLLDDSIVRQRWWLTRAHGGLRLCRLYSFDFSGDGDSRRHGYIVLLGHKVVEHHMEPWPVAH